MTHPFKIRAECTLFFEENPYTYETAQGVADRLGRKSEHIQPVLDELVQICILEQIGSGDGSLYRYLQPDSMVIR